LRVEAVTRLSETCCDRLVAHDALRIIYSLIRSCNRSKPHMQVLKHALEILNNLNSFDVEVFSDEMVDVVVEVMLNYREEEVFGAACRVLAGHLPYADRVQVHP
jgi:abnormal spindle-like microcephaly-associated protein